MSEDDGLRDAFRALRDEHDGASDLAVRTRARILLQARPARRPPTSRMVLLPLAAALIVGTAWAAKTGRLGAALHSFFAEAAPPSPSAGPSPGPSPRLDALPVAPAPAPPAGPDGAIDAGLRTVDVDHLPAVAEAPARPAARPVPPVADGGATARDAEDALYHAAHEAHFVERDPARAVSAWDAYLAAHPDGRFLPEAHYNRALMLVRAGRRDEAKSALRPFAEGRYGDYRRSEAKALLEALP